MGRILVACEFSGVVRDAFIRAGHDAVSVDLLETESPGPHIVGDVVRVIESGRWDLIIAHPPCTHLAVSGNRWHAGTERRAAAVRWTADLWEKMSIAAPRLCLENPVGALSSSWRKPTQYVQPWEHGHGETKKTGLWLENLPALTPSNIVEGRTGACHMTPDRKDRWKDRSRTYTGIADAMASQWGPLLP